MLRWLVRPFRQDTRPAYSPLAPGESDGEVPQAPRPRADGEADAADADSDDGASSRAQSISSAEEQEEDVPETPLPKTQLVVLLLMRMSEPIAQLQIFPYIAQFLQHVLPSIPHEQLGYYAGSIESAFAAAQVCVVLFWGSMSDRYGRKPILLGGLVGTFVSVVCMGMSTSLPAMIAARLIAGFSNGNIGVLKATIAEITDSTNQARAFAFVPLSYALGTLIGPYLGAGLADPYGVLDKEGNYLPGYEDDTRFFARYPFAFPCFVTSLFNLAAILLGVFFLKETLGTEPPHPGQAKTPAVESTPNFQTVAGTGPVKNYGTLAQLPESQSPVNPRADPPNALASEAEAQQRWRQALSSSPASPSERQRQRKLSSERRLSSVYQDGDQDEGSALTVAALSRADQSPHLGRRRSSAWDLVTGSNRDVGPDDRAIAPPGLHVHSPAHYFHQHRRSSRSSLASPAHSRRHSTSGAALHGTDAAEQEPVRLPRPSLRSLMTADIFNVISSQMLLNLLNISYMAVLPLFCYTRVPHGGVGFKRSDIGNILGATGVLSIVVQLGLLPSLMRHYHGALGLIRRAVPLQALVWVCFPLAQLGARVSLQYGYGTFLPWAAISVMVVVKVLTNTSLVAATVLINQHAPSRAALGTINGLSAMCGSLSRTIGPAASTSLFAYSAAEGASPVRRNAVWIIQIAISLICFLLTLRIRAKQQPRD